MSVGVCVWSSLYCELVTCHYMDKYYINFGIEFSNLVFIYSSNKMITPSNFIRSSYTLDTYKSKHIDIHDIW